MADNEKEVYPPALLKPCKRCKKRPVLSSDIHSDDSMVYYVACETDNNHGRKIRLYHSEVDAIEGWNLRGGE